MIYNHRARVYQYQNQLELAGDEIEKGLTLEPKQPLLRISKGYQQMREGQLSRAVDTLEEVIRDDASLRIVFPTIAMCYVQLGRSHAGGDVHHGRGAVGGGGGQRDGVPAGDVLRGGRGCAGGAALAAARDLSGQ